MNIFKKKKAGSHSWCISKIKDPEKPGKINVEKVPFQGSFGKQHGKRAQTLLRLAWQKLYHIHWSLWRQLTFKKSLLVIWKISRLFPNTLSADGKYSLLNRDNLRQPIQMQLSRKKKTFSSLFSAFLISNLNFEHFQKKKDDSHSWCISGKPENLLRSMSKKSRLHDRNFTLFLDHCQCNWLPKSLFWWHPKSQDFFLTHWVPMASTLFLIETI